MAEVARHSRVRDVNGPRAVDGHRTPSGRHRPSKPESGHHRRKRSHHHSVQVQDPAFELHVISQPAQHIALGATIETSIVLSLKASPSERQPKSSRSIDTSPLLAIATLVAELGNGETLPLENGYMTGQKMFDTVHGIPEQCVDNSRATAAAGGRSNNEPCRMALGYFTFPGLLIRQVGTYRVRVALLRMAASGGATTLATVDSEPIVVQRRLCYQ